MNFIMIFWRKNLKMLHYYMDTGNFIIEFTGENFDDIMLENKEYFDLSNFSKESKYYSDDNKNVPGKMKDEYGGKVIFEFAAPKPKSYTVIDKNSYEKRVNKGHNSNIRSDEFKDLINNKKVVRQFILKKTIKYLYLVLMIRGMLKMME